MYGNLGLVLVFGHVGTISGSGRIDIGNVLILLQFRNCAVTLVRALLL